MSRNSISKKLLSPVVTVPVILVVVLTLGSVWFLHNFEKKSYHTRRDISPAARNNPLLAAEKYLRATGLNTSSRAGLGLISKLPSAHDAILIRHLPKDISNSSRERLLAWVVGGGHLLLVPNPLAEKHQDKGNLPIVARLGVRFAKTESNSDCGCSTTGKDKKKKSVASHSPREAANDRPTAIRDAVLELQAGGYPIRLGYNGAALLEDRRHSSTYRIGGSYLLVPRKDGEPPRQTKGEEQKQTGDWLLEYRLGAGRITVMSDMSVFSNSEIGRYDHAYFLSWLLGDAAHVWLLYSSNATPLPALLWRLAPSFWLSFFLLLILVGWRMQKRSGVLLRPPADDHRNLLAHIDGSGHYGWRLNKLAAVLAANRETLLARWSRRKLGIATERRETSLDTATLTAQTGLGPEEIETALRQQVGSEQDLIRTTRALQHLQTLLQGGDSSRHDG